MRGVRVKSLRLTSAIAVLTMAASSTSCSGTGRWIPSSDRMNNKEFELPVLVAREWAEQNLDFKNGNYDIQYHAVKNDNGYVVYLDPIYPNKVVTDDEWCIFINNKDKVENAEQCLSP